MTLDKRILDIMKRYMGMLVSKKVLTTIEEVEANTNETNLVAAPVVAELNDKLAGQPEWIKDSTGKITGYKTGGADTVFPFNSNYQINATFAGSRYGGSGYRSVIRHTFAIKVINGTISCSDLGRLFTEAVPETGGNHAQDIYLQSLTVTKI